VRQRELPAPLRTWLLDEQSLTERLIRASDGNFRVQRLSQRWQRPLRSESRLLQIPRAQWALVREVALRCHDEPWVYARSVMPVATLQGKLRRLRRLQDRSLGALLFQQPGLRRQQFELARIPPGSRFIHPDLRQQSPAWARRSCFELSGNLVLVSEVFLERFQAR
jgi:chorismate--pyruvate lyase